MPKQTVAATPESPALALGKHAKLRKDDVLIAAFKEGDHTAFQELVLKYEQRVYNHCLRMVNDEVESYDLTQEVFLKVFRKIKNYEHTYAFYTWLYRITVNCCIDYLRRKKRHMQSVSLSAGGGSDAGDQGREQEIPDTTFVPEDAAMNQELDAVLHAAIGQLSEKLRSIIILKEIEGFSYEEIADVLGCSRGTVKSRLFRARERLKELLADYVNA
ncbi:MAG: sigma-70 family RNA polymerase sigma factor [Gammaproteobacteria bacterium]|nr:sigma-70 family RNA polymerase sigma factor [Gammaproteobacteria bacterium]NIR28998.1 sigma-70 family RNA polymerase sigma factor [Gammaproteobacteria bacterium]NIR97474.1 sigma-70 family RNA polymerase sigma factor [Gammaproteobacteria bacterium]NIT63106.1 sigma-70 family RNA polymerase sigma factor [Gammaproteobacteria bacterium]NIV20061.1 sigma-70 family RNA polymerase sigma factor [Gammaproteobacteria bacterium]